MTTPTKPGEESRAMLPFSDMRTHGLLWLINATVFHPRGLAMSFHIATDDDDEPTGTVLGWSMLGDGTESWYYGEGIADEEFLKADAFLRSLTNREDVPLT